MYDLGLLTSTKVSFERVQTCTIHTSFSIFNCGWCCNGHKWWAHHDQRHLKCVGTRPEGPCPLHNFVPTIDHIHVEICTKKLFQAAMIFFLPAAGPYQVWYQDLYMVNWSLTLLKKISPAATWVGVAAPNKELMLQGENELFDLA